VCAASNPWCRTWDDATTQVVIVDVERSPMALQDPPDGTYPHVGAGYCRWQAYEPCTFIWTAYSDTRSSSANVVLFGCCAFPRWVETWSSLVSYNDRDLPDDIPQYMKLVVTGEAMYSSGNYR